MKTSSLPLLRHLLPCLLCALALHPTLSAEPPATPAEVAEADAEDAEDRETGEAKPEPGADKFWQALQLFRKNTAPDHAAGRALLQESSDLEFSHAQVLLGNCLLSGSYGFPKQPRKALNLFRLAAERGNAFAMVSLGTCYATATGTRRDDARAEEWLVASLATSADYNRPVPPPEYVEAGQDTQPGVAGELVSDPVDGSRATAHFLLGQIRTRQNKPAEAQTHFVAAATAGPDGRSGVYQAAVDAALNYAFGKGIPRDATKAREMLEQSRRLKARMGVNLIQNYVQLKLVDDFAVADMEESLEKEGEVQQSALQLQIAQTLANKKSKDYNAAEAAEWYRLAADNGQVWGMLSLAFLLADGELGSPDLPQAFQWFEKAGEGDRPKHFLGAANLAICLREGIGTAPDEARAAAIFRKHRDLDIVCYLGSLGQAPRQIVTYEEAVALNQTWAKDKNDPHAQYLLARRYYEGSGVPRNANEAQRWLKRAAKARHGIALFQYGWFCEFQPRTVGLNDATKAAKAAVEAYRDATAVGNIDGMINYARCLQRGFGLPKDEAGAIALYERCLQQEPANGRAHSNLADLYRERLARTGSSIGTAEWREKMLFHYEAALAQDPAFAAIALGDLNYEGKLIKQDWAKAYRLYEQALDNRYSKADAHYRLGFMHEFGQSVPVTYTEAAYHYRIAALEGNIPALRRLINFYLTGTGVSLDFDRAAYWLGLMVRYNQLDALPMIADVLLKKQEYKQAVVLLKRLVDVPNSTIAAHAHERLSVCYQQGQGVKANPRRAEKHFRIAVQMGNGNALTTFAHQQIAAGQVSEGIATLTNAARSTGRAAYNLGQIYYFGEQVPANMDQAMLYLRQAAQMNTPEAQYFLASLTWNNEPSGPKLEEAVDLATRAENLGHPKAAELRRRLEERLLQANRKPEENSRARSS